MGQQVRRPPQPQPAVIGAGEVPAAARKARSSRSAETPRRPASPVMRSRSSTASSMIAIADSTSSSWMPVRSRSGISLRSTLDRNGLCTNHSATPAASSARNPCR